MTVCSVYGLGVRVNVPIAGLAGLSAPAKVDVHISVGPLPAEFACATEAEAAHQYTSPYLDDHGQPALNVYRLFKGSHFRLNYTDGTVVIVDTQGDNVWASSPPGATIEDTAAYLLGPILGLVLRLRGVTCLHASAIAVDGKAIALVGPSGAGKSTTAAAFAKLGYPVMSDDVVPLSDFGDRFDVRPAYPRVRLWPESATSLFGSPDALPRITPNWGKRFLNLNGPGYRFQAEPLPLSAIYLLGERSSAVTTPTIEEVPPAEGLMKLISDTYATSLLSMPQRASEFEMLSRLVGNVPIRRITPADDPSRIGALCDAIVEDVRQLGAPAAAPISASMDAPAFNAAQA